MVDGIGNTDLSAKPVLLWGGLMIIVTKLGGGIGSLTNVRAAVFGCVEFAEVTCSG